MVSHLEDLDPQYPATGDYREEPHRPRVLAEIAEEGAGICYEACQVRQPEERVEEDVGPRE